MMMKQSSGIARFCSARQSAFYLKSDIDLPDDTLAAMGDSGNELHLQDIADLGREIFGRSPLSVTPLPGKGTFHRLYRLAVSSEASYILRTNAPSYPYRAFDFHIDRWAMNKLAGARLPALQVYAVDTSRKKYPFDYEIVEEAGGSLLAKFDIDHPANAPVMLALGSTIAGLHGIATDGFGLLDVRRILADGEGKGLLGSWKDYLFLNLDKHIRVCLDIGAITLPEGMAIESAFAGTQAILDGITPSLVHGDLSNHNIYSDGKRITAIVDWEDCLSGDSVFDIASWGTFIGNDERRQLFLQGYRSVRPLPADFELRYWLYYLRMVLAKTVHRHRFRYYLHDRIPAAQRLQNGLEKVQRLVAKGGW